MWVAAAPGAGFSETADFLKVFQNEPVQPTWYEKKLWHLYDCTDYALNLFNCPTVAYSGEVDRQKQAADMMAKALAEEGIELVHVIGAKAGHQYTPEAKAEINRRIDSIVRSAATRCPSRFDSPPGRCATTARSGFRSTAWSSTGSGRASTPICSAETGSMARDHHEERLRVDADDALRPLPAGHSTRSRR